MILTEKQTISSKDTMLNTLTELKDFCSQHELSEEQLDILSSKLKDNNFVITVLGEFNRGKSSLINSLLGSSVLPMGVTPTTATINIVTYSETAYATVNFIDGRVETFKDDIAGSLLKLNAAEIETVNIGYPAEILKGVNIVDTPGVNDLNDQKVEITYGYIPKSDAVIFILDSEQLLSRSEATFLDKRILNRDINKVLFIANKADQVSSEELQSIIDYAEDKLKNFVNEPVVIPYSAKLALQGKSENNPDKTAKSFYDKLIETLNTHVIEKQEAILLENTVNHTANFVLSLQKNLELNKETFSREKEELENNVRLIEGSEEELKEKLKNILSNSKAEVESLSGKQVTQLKEFALQFTAVVSEEVDSVSYEDLKKYFPLFVQDKFKEWIELHEVEINIEMIKIYEKSVKEIDKLFEELKKDLSYDIDFSSIRFKPSDKTYGIDIGTTAMMTTGLFVMFLGGLFPLIAGALLLVGGGFLSFSLKGNREKAFKEDFKELAKGCIIKTADKIEGKLIELINASAQKLEEHLQEMFNKEFETIKVAFSKALDDKITRSETINLSKEKIDENIVYLKNVQNKLGEMVQ
jgi:small GTP-binding protein